MYEVVVGVAIGELPNPVVAAVVDLQTWNPLSELVQVRTTCVSPGVPTKFVGVAGNPPVVVVVLEFPPAALEVEREPMTTSKKSAKSSTAFAFHSLGPMFEPVDEKEWHSLLILDLLSTQC